MPDPKKLKVDDRVRFVSIPKEWDDPSKSLFYECTRFMMYMLERKFSSRVYEIDEYGTPWIYARLKINGKIEEHTWGIFEHSGWVKVKKRVI